MVTTVTTVTTSIISNIDVLSLALVAILTLLLLLIAKEVSSSIDNGQARRFNRTLNVAIVPLTIVFVITAAFEIIRVIAK